VLIFTFKAQLIHFLHVFECDFPVYRTKPTLQSNLRLYCR